MTKKKGLPKLPPDLLERILQVGRVNILITDEADDPYVEEADANPERRNNGCQIYRVGDTA